MKSKIISIAMLVVCVVMTSALAVPSTAQSIDMDPLAKFRKHNINQTKVDQAKVKNAKVGEVYANADLDPEYPFTFVLITQNGPDGLTASQREANVKQWFSQPATPQMKAWRSMASVREFAATDPFITEQHPRLLNQHQSLPIVALVDSRGGDWCSLSGNTLPGSEYETARVFEIHYGAIMESAAKQTNQNVHVMSPNQLAEARSNYIYSPRPNRSSPNRGPTPFQPDVTPNRPFRPFGPIVPEGGLVQIPQEYDINANTTMDPALRTLGYVAVAGLVTFGLLITGGMIIAAAIRAFAQTDPDDEDMVINQPIDADDDDGL